jgi:hypothetical protein
MDWTTLIDFAFGFILIVTTWELWVCLAFIGLVIWAVAYLLMDLCQ